MSFERTHDEKRAKDSVFNCCLGISVFINYQIGGTVQKDTQAITEILENNMVFSRGKYRIGQHEMRVLIFQLTQHLQSERSKAFTAKSKLQREADQSNLRMSDTSINPFGLGGL